MACGASRGEEHLQRELAFFVPYVDLEAEERAVREVLGQRKLVVDQVVRRPEFVALSASTLDAAKSAVRVITQRGVVLGEDGDTQDYFGLAAVGLFVATQSGPEPDPLIGLITTQRHESAGCAQLYRVLPDGRVLAVAVHLEQFGSRACLHSLRPLAAGGYSATLAWPSLSPDSAPLLHVEMARETARLDRPNDPTLGLRLRSEGAWVERETKRLEAPLPGSAPFSERQARAVAQAALALALGRSADAQLGAYRSAIGKVTPGSPEAETVAITSTHIGNGWLDTVEQSEPATSAGDGGEPIDPESTVIEPTP
jgi:hypothetical protein